MRQRTRKRRPTYEKIEGSSPVPCPSTLWGKQVHDIHPVTSQLKCNSGSQEEGYSQYQRMLSTLSQCEFSMGKTLLVYDMNLREMENYEKIYKEIECSIAGAHEKIAECKKQILQAKRIRKNRQEYDALAKVIQHHPDRHETLKELEALGKELEHLSHIKESVEDKLELRRKQFHVLLSTIHELQQTLENDDKLSEVEEAQESAMEADPKP